MSVEPRDVGRWIRMAVTDEITPVRVPVIQAKQTGDTCPRSWDWVERTIWTDRMLDALEQGVKGGCWFSLIDKVIWLSTLVKWLTKSRETLSVITRSEGQTTK